MACLPPFPPATVTVNCKNCKCNCNCNCNFNAEFLRALIGYYLFFLIEVCTVMCRLFQFG